MARQYKLRLRDGTILAVDQAGLSTWLIDDRAMVQPMGTRGWRPLREVLAQERMAAAMSPVPPLTPPPPPPPPRPRPLADEEIPNIPIKPLSLEAPAGPDPVLDSPVDAFVPERLAEPSPAPPAPPRVIPAPPLPATPSPAAPRPAAPPVAKATAPAPPRAARPAPPRVAAPLIPEPAPVDAPPATQDLPIIPFKRIDDEPAGPRVSVRVAAPVGSQGETDLADALALVIQKEVAEGKAVVISEDDLEELDLVDDERVEPVPPLPPKEAFEAEVSRSVNQLVGWARSAMSAVRAKARAARAAASAPRPQPVQPPPTLRELPVVPLAGIDKPSAPKRRAMMAGLAAAVVVAAVAAAIFILRSNSGDSTATATPVAPTTIPEATPPPLPSDVLVAAERLPHLAPETVQLLISTSPFGSPDPSDLFRRARAAIRSGAATLTPEEDRELAVLERAVLVRLSPTERERVMAYDRVRGARDLAPAEDARVLSLFARGARGLPAPHRERLQALSGKAIAAALASP